MAHPSPIFSTSKWFRTIRARDTAQTMLSTIWLAAMEASENIDIVTELKSIRIMNGMVITKPEGLDVTWGMLLRFVFIRPAFRQSNPDIASPYGWTG